MKTPNSFLILKKLKKQLIQPMDRHRIRERRKLRFVTWMINIHSAIKWTCTRAQ